jgi:hypothetical protein
MNRYSVVARDWRPTRNHTGKHSRLDKEQPNWRTAPHMLPKAPGCPPTAVAGAWARQNMPGSPNHGFVGKLPASCGHHGLQAPRRACAVNTCNSCNWQACSKTTSERGTLTSQVHLLVDMPILTVMVDPALSVAAWEEAQGTYSTRLSHGATTPGSRC